MRDFGTIRKLPSGRWQALYVHEGSRYKGPRTFLTREEGANWLSETHSEILRGEWCNPLSGEVLFEDFAAEWLGSKRLAVKTSELYEWILRSQINPFFGKKRLSDITPLSVRTWFNSLEKPSTAAKSYTILSSILKSAVEDQILPRNPCRLKGAGAEPFTERPIATVEEIHLLADAITPKLRLFVLLAAWCQLRKGELLGLRTEDVDELHRSLRVSQTKVRSMNGRNILKPPKTSSGIRTISIPPFLMGEVENHRKKYSADFLFPVSHSTVYKHFYLAREAINRPDLTIHDLRHTGLTLAAASGATVAELMRRAGHKSVAASLRYQHATLDRDRVLAEALGELARSVHVARDDPAREPLTREDIG